jgi:2-oxoglutarate dehydrogenase E1 component
LSSILFSEFEGTKRVDPNISGDVKYHLGFSSDLATEGGSVHLALAFNPSHLEIINPVVEGSVRARQDRRGDLAHRLVLPVQVHGDAALAGQGVVAETLNLSCLRGFETGGTLHVVINNQVGFSISDPLDARTGHYCTDVAKMIDAPVLHVNGDDPEACVWAAELALDYRATFHRDVFIDLVCWRRYGHNESDEPRVTQPGMYHQIDAHPGVLATYARRLEAEGVVSADEVRHMQREYRDALDRGDRVAEAGESDYISIHGAPWKPYIGQTWQAPATTGVPASMLRDLGQALTRLPEGFQLHPRIQRIINQRIEMTEGQLPIDWGFAENLAYASLLSEGFPVRLCGQDAGRGTFFHRHVALHDQSRGGAPEGRIHLPLQHLQANQAWFQVIDSTLSEEGVLGFEYGYTSTEPKVMVIWEAQYGDFANGAQAVIDQFISAGELKWQRLSGLVMFLPHGFEGQGPEHSSARLERYLQLCAEENMQVVVPSTPAQMFHMLRRQMIRPYRKPLIVMTPKSLLRHKLSVSTLEELAHGRFQEVIRDDRSPEGIQRVVVCSGKVYFELIEAREGRKLEHVALVRLEQLYPFPDQALRAELARYPGATVVWTQEEPENQGAWRETRDALKGCLRDDQMLTLASRPCSASPAVGSAAKHLEQQKNLIDAALGEAVRSALGAVGSR